MLLSHDITKIYITQEAGKVGQNDITWGHASSTDMAQDQQVSKAEELVYLSMNTGVNNVL